MFDINAFNKNLQQAQDTFDEDKSLPEEVAYERSQGLRFVIETGIPSEKIGMKLRDVIHAEFSVEPLFTRGDSQTKDKDLARFYLLIITHVVRNDIQQNPYDAAYYILDFCEFDGVEPDLPFQNYWGLSTRATASTSPVDYAWALRNINAEQAWNLKPTNGKTDGEGISIAHLDTGWAVHDDLDSANFSKTRFKDFIDINNPDAKDPLNYLGNRGHGTKTGSIIMSRGGLSKLPPYTSKPGQITGVARKATYVSVRCIKKVWFIYASHIAKAIDYARCDNSDVISMSLGGLMLKALLVSLQKAVGDNMLVVAAAGNNVRAVVYPARYKESIAVAATNINCMPWKHTSRGKAVDISAPGEEVWHADPVKGKGKVESGSGTSYATAHMAGSAALWLAFHGKNNLLGCLKGGATLQDLFRDCLKKSVTVPPCWESKKYGAGIVDLYELLKLSPKNNLTVTAPMPPKALSGNFVDEDMLKVCLVIIFKQSDSPIDSIFKFNNELCNVFLENPLLFADLQDLFVNWERSDNKELIEFKQKLAPLMSRELLNAAGWSSHNRD